MKSGYDQFFKQVRGQANPKTKVTLNMKNPAAPQEKVVGTAPRAKQPKVSAKPARAKRAPLPWSAIVFLIVGLGVSIWGLLAPKSFEHVLAAVEIGAMTQATAAEEKPAGPAGANAEKSAETKAEGASPGSAHKAEWTQEEMSFFSKLNERKKELDLREAELNKLDEELQQQKLALDKRFKELEQMRAQIADTLKSQVEVDKEKVDKLVEFYSNMKPQQAAKIMETLNEDLAVETLGRMKKKNAAEIMNLLDAKKAQSISEKFAGYKRK